MSEPYVPTTVEVRAAWIEAYSVPAWGGTIDAGHAPRERVAEFDRWLAAHDRQVKAEALRGAAGWLDDPRTLPDIDENAALAVIRGLRYRADRIESEVAP